MKASISDELLVRYILQETSLEEREEVETALSESQDLQQRKSELEKTYQLGNQATFSIPGSEEALARFEEKQRATKKRKLWPSMAAAAVAIFLLCFGAMQFMDSTPPMVALEVSTHLKTIQLPDGSQLTLEAGAEVEIHEEFLENRLVHLKTGRAFFDVKKMNGLPFRVQSGSSEIKVLGTRFDVSQSEEGTSARLQEGSIQFTTEEDKIMMKPGEKVTVNQGHLAKTLIPNSNAFSWIEHQLNFNSQTLAEVQKILASHFSQSVEIEEHLKNCRLTGDFSGDALNDVLDIISITINGEVEKTPSAFKLVGPGCNE